MGGVAPQTAVGGVFRPRRHQRRSQAPRRRFYASLEVADGANEKIYSLALLLLIRKTIGESDFTQVFLTAKKLMTEEKEAAKLINGERRTKKQAGRQHFAERIFERALWESRLLMLVGVVFSALMAVGVFFMTAIDALNLALALGEYADFSLSVEGRDALRGKIITLVVKTIDGFLIAAILLILALGLYELFVNKLDAARRSEVAKKLLQTRTLDDLKHRVAGLLLLVLVIEFFQHALRFKYGSAIDLLYLALGILLVSAAFYLSNLRTGKERGADDAG